MMNELENRCQMYSFLSRIFREEADTELINSLKMINYSQYDDDSELSKGFRLLGESVSNFNENALLELARDYARIFFAAGIGRNQGAYPYESVYTSEEHLMEQEAFDDVIRIYAEEGLIKSDKYAEAADHIAFELEFMTILCKKAIQAIDLNNNKAYLKYKGKLDDFFINHIGNWATAFADDVERLAEQNFYKAAAMILRGFLHDEEYAMV